MNEVILPPKSCFGNYLHKEKGCNDHHNCEQQGECNMYTNYFKGACDCPYKKSCHLMRQKIASDYRNEIGDTDIRKCDFYKYFI